MKINRILIAFTAVFLLISLNLYGQDKSQVAEDMAVKLQQKVLLSKDQTAKVKDVLISYLGSNAQSSRDSANKSIESILDKKQKAKYDNIKNDWWSSVQKEAAKLQGK